MGAVRYLFAVLLVGCSFSKGLDPAQIDAAEVLIDAAPDMMEMQQPAPCPIGVTSTTGTDRGRVGGDGGGANFGPLQCDNATDRIVGVAVKLSDQSTIYGSRSAQALLIACAPVSVDKTTNVGTTGTTYTKEVSGDGDEDWAPSTLSPFAMCAPGHVVDGLTVRTGTNDNVFSNVDVRCGQLNGMAETIANAIIHVDNSGQSTANATTVNCNTNEVLVRMTNRTGSGFDSANLYCAPATCL
jgi:hypothetical protein